MTETVALAPPARLLDWCESCQKHVADCEEHEREKHPQIAAQRKIRPADEIATPVRRRGVRKGAVETWEDHVEAWHALGRRAEEALWGRAAVVVSLKGRYGEAAVEKFAAEVGQNPSHLYRLAQVHEQFVGGKSRQRENLSFTHHAEALAAPDPDAALDLAEAERLSAPKLRARIRPPTTRKAAVAETREEPPAKPKPVSEAAEWRRATMDEEAAAVLAAAQSSGPAAPAPREEPKPAAPAMNAASPLTRVADLLAAIDTFYEDEMPRDPEVAAALASGLEDRARLVRRFAASLATNP